MLAFFKVQWVLDKQLRPVFVDAVALAGNAELGAAGAFAVALAADADGIWAARLADVSQNDFPVFTTADMAKTCA